MRASCWRRRLSGRHSWTTHVQYLRLRQVLLCDEDLRDYRAELGPRLASLYEPRAAEATLLRSMALHIGVEMDAMDPVAEALRLRASC